MTVRNIGTEFRHGLGSHVKPLLLSVISRSLTVVTGSQWSENILKSISQNHFTHCRGRGICSNETVKGTWAIECTGFLVSRSLILPAAPPEEPQALIDDFTFTQKKTFYPVLIGLWTSDQQSLHVKY